MRACSAEGFLRIGAASVSRKRPGRRLPAAGRRKLPPHFSAFATAWQQCKDSPKTAIKPAAHPGRAYEVERIDLRAARAHFYPRIQVLDIGPISSQSGTAFRTPRRFAFECATDGRQVLERARASAAVASVRRGRQTRRPDRAGRQRTTGFQPLTFRVRMGRKGARPGESAQLAAISQIRSLTCPRWF